MLTIAQGPFKGTTFTEDQCYYSAGDDQPKLNVLMPVLNQVFLDKFDPMLGWSLQITSDILPLDMYPLERANTITTTAVPAVKFSAALIDPQSRMVATATTVWTMEKATSHETGETNARRRLYDAIGLQSRFDVPAGYEIPQGASRTRSSGSVIAIKPTCALPAITPVFEEPDTATASEAEEPAPVVVTSSEATAPAEPVDTGDVEGQVADGVAEVVEVAQAAPAAPAAPIGIVSSDAPPARSKRTRSGDNDPPTQVLIDQVKRLCGMRNMPVPVMDTKAQATEALRSMQGG